MSKLYFDFKYRDAQIIKHALQYYLTRNACVGVLFIRDAYLKFTSLIATLYLFLFSDILMVSISKLISSIKACNNFIFSSSVILANISLNFSTKSFILISLF